MSSTTQSSAMSSTSNNGGGGHGPGEDFVGDGVPDPNNVPSTLTNSQATAPPQYGSGTSILQNQLSAPPQQQQQQQQHQQNNSSPGMQNVMGMYHGQNLGTGGMEQPHHMHHHPVQQHHFPNHIQHHLMDGQHPHSQQMTLPPQLPPAAPFNMNHHHNQHAHHQQQQYMPFGMHNNNYGNAGNPYGNMGNPQLNPFHPHHLQSQQQGHSMNPMQQQQPSCFVPHGPPPCMMNFQQQQSLMGQRSGVPVGWLGPGGHPANIPVCGNGRGRNRKMNQYVASPPPSTIKVITSRTRPPTPVNSDPNALPGGLDVLWRELHPDCHKLMGQQDIPDTARVRGYFTVCELLALKRTLQGRFAAGGKPSGQTIIPVDVSKIVVPPVKEESKRGQKRGHGKDVKSTKRASKVKCNDNKDKKRMLQQPEQGDLNGQTTTEVEKPQQDRDNGSGSAMEDLSNDLGSTKQPVHVPVPLAVAEVEVSGVVKAAMETLTSHPEQIMSNGGAETSDSGKDHNLDHTITGDLESMEDIQCEHPNPQSVSNCNSLNGCIKPDQGEHATEHPAIPLPQFADFAVSARCLGESGCDGSGDSDPNMKTDVTGVPSSNMDALTNAVHSLQQSPYRSPLGYSGGPPPSTHRTLSLVLKLLQFGPYQIRSFSLNNPNRLKVLFNSQRITYECQLPLVQQSSENSAPQTMRKILNVDICFDQISYLDFTSDSLCMRVEGAPLLQLSFTPVHEKAEDEPSLTHHDVMLLDQIEKGQLKLNPVHQLFFLNERLVALLEAQCREHPRLGRLFQS